MVRILVQQAYSENLVYIEGVCNTGDTMPKEVGDRDVVSGSQMFDIDTAKPYMFDEKTDSWKEIGGGDA